MDRRQALKYYKFGKSLPQGTSESQHYFDLAIKSDQTFSYAYFEKSVPFNKRGDFAKGFKLLNKAVVLNPKMHLGYRGWIRLVKLKDYQGCINDLKELQKIKSKNTYNAWGENINYLIGLSYLELRKHNKANKYFDLSLKEDSNHSKLNLCRYYKAIGLFFENRYEESIQNLKLCIEQKVNFTEAFYYLGINYFKINKQTESRYYLTKALNLINRGYKLKNAYNEVAYECYRKDIVTAISHDRKNQLI